MRFRENFAEENLAEIFTVPAYSTKRFETFTFRYVLFFLIAFTMKVRDTQQSEAPN